MNPAAAAEGQGAVLSTPRGPRLATRIALLFLLLLLLVQAAGFAVIQHGIGVNARAQLRDELALGHRVLGRLLALNRERLMQGATLLAADFGFRDAVTDGDVPTIASSLENHAGRIGADVAALLDVAGEVRAAGGATRGAVDTALQHLSLPGGAAAAPVAVMALVDGQAYQFVVVPLRAPVLMGWVVMGFPLKASLLTELQSLSSALSAIVVHDGRERPSLSLAQLPGVSPAGVQRLLAAAATPVSAGVSSAAEEVDLGEGSGLLTRVPLIESTRGPQAEVLLLQSVDKITAPYRRQQRQLAAIALLGVLIFGLGSVFTARRVTTPLRALARASARLGTGDYSQQVEHTERSDEIGELARAFDTMQRNLDANEAEIRRLAYWDRLTGLPNRAQFVQAVAAALAQQAPPADGQPGLAVLLLDLARLKHVNDVLGYDNGDRLLRTVAQRLTLEGVHEGTLVARVGGDEFAVLLTGAAAGRSEATAQCIATTLEAPIALDDHRVDVSATFGIACWPTHADQAEALLGRAELAMLAAKRRGLVALSYEPGIDAASAQTLSLLGDLKRAVECEEFRLYLQPKVALASGEAIGAEALVRWQAPGRGLVPPMEFIPFAEQTGFIRQLTLWVFEACCKSWRTLDGLGLQRLSLNLSTRDLLDPALPAKLNALRHRHGVPAQAFCLEITESAIMDDPQRAQATLAQLNECGYKLSIDDFGTGYSSLAYLKRLPVSELKIDKSFVMGMERDGGDAKIVRSTIDLAHNLGLSVVAEGVENAAIFQALRELGCDEAQGYHMGRPMPLADFEAWAGRWQAAIKAQGALSAGG